MGRRASCPLDFVTELRLSGEVGALEDEVLTNIMAHLCQTTQLAVARAPTNRLPRPGEWFPLREVEELAPAGRVRLYLQSETEVETVRRTLHEQAIAVGLDWVTLTVHSDLRDALAVAGNGLRRRAAGGPSPA